MQPRQSFNESLTLVRPFLDLPKSDLVEYCTAQNLNAVQDPSNDHDRYARVRLRKSWDVLAQEGLTSKRLGTLSARMTSIRDALDFYTDQLYEKAKILQDTHCIEFNLNELKSAPYEIVLRIILRAVHAMEAASDYGPRREKLEALVRDLLCDEPFQKRTLGWCIFTRDDRRATLRVERE